MTVRAFTAGSTVAMIGAWTIWILIINYLHPVQAGVVGFLLFYLSLFLAIAGTSNLIGYLIRRVLAPEQFPSYAVRPAFRQGSMLGMLVVLLLLLKQIKLYQWWVGIIAIIITLAIEIIFLGHENTKRRKAKRNPDNSK